MAQKWSPELMDKLDSKYSKKRIAKIKVEIDGSQVEVEVDTDENFRDSKVTECIQEYIEKLQYMTKLNRGKEVGGELSQMYFAFMIVKHFTELDIPNAHKEQLAVLRKLVDNNVLFQVFPQMNQEEIQRVAMNIVDGASKFVDNIDGLEDKLKELKLENPELLKDY